jgi:hypothetical protein
MAALLPLIQWQQTAPSVETEGARSVVASLQSHFPNAPTLPGGIEDAAYREAALKLLLSSDESVTVPVTGRKNDYRSSYWITDGSERFKRNFGDNGAPDYAAVELSNAVAGNPESPFYPNRSSAPDADPNSQPAGIPVPYVADSAVPNDLATVRTAGNYGSATSPKRNPKNASNNASQQTISGELGVARELGRSTSTKASS